MTQYTKPTVLPAWAESAGGADVLQPSNAEIQAGWPLSNVPPSRKRFNWVLKYLAQGVRYILQRGMPEWDAAEDYRVNDRVMASDGKTYKCIQAGINKDPTTQTAYWTRWGFTLAEYDAEGTTPAQFDNTVKRASTAFVQRALGNFQNGGQVTLSTALTAANVGQLIQFAGSTSGQTITLPSLSAVPLGAALAFVNNGSQSVAIARSGGDTIVAGLASSLTSFNLAPGDSAIMGYVGGAWFVVSGAVQLANSSGFGFSTSANGYQKLPSGLIIQWGKATIVGTGGSNFSFPIAFPTACRSLVGSIDDVSATTEFCTAYNNSNTSGAFRLNTANTRTVDWVAIGY